MIDTLEHPAFSPYEPQGNIEETFEAPPSLSATMQNLGGEAVKALMPFGSQMMEPLSDVSVETPRAAGTTGVVTTSIDQGERVEDDTRNTD